jgi:hypothetical protein
MTNYYAECQTSYLVSKRGKDRSFVKLDLYREGGRSVGNLADKLRWQKRKKGK